MHFPFALWHGVDEVVEGKRSSVYYGEKGMHR
jgi:hypothetical protein